MYHFGLFILPIVLSVLLRFAASDYPFGIFKLFFWPRLMLLIQKPNKIYIACFQSIYISVYRCQKSKYILSHIIIYTLPSPYYKLQPPSGAPAHSVLNGVRVAQAFCVVLCRSLFLSICCFFHLPLYCLSFFDLRPLITNLPSSNNFLHYLTFFEY